MKVIWEAITWGVTALPLKKNIIPRFMKEGKRLINNERCTDYGERRISGELEGELLGLSCSLFLLCMSNGEL
jgi:hypothetical protein